MMPTYRFPDMTWQEVNTLDRARTIFVLPVGALEAHGPHLPLATDVVISEAMAKCGARRLASRGYEVVLLPALIYTTAGFASAFAGTISLRAETVTATLIDIARSLAASRFPVLAIANSHLDPEHLGSLRAALSTIEAEGSLRVVFPDLTQKPWALRLTEEFKSGACHAGRFETSIVEVARPDLVREGLRKGLPPNARSLSRAIREGKKTFHEAGGELAYFGAPAEATRAEGAETIETLGAILEEATLQALGVDGR